MFRRLWGAISRTFIAFADGVAEARRMARAYDELAKMSEPELQDIGINRADIPAVISQTYCAPDSIFNPASGGRQEKVVIAGPQRSTRRPRSQS